MLSPPTVLSNAKAAFSFGIHTSVQYVLPDGQVDQSLTGKSSIPTLVTQLVIGCRRKAVIYTWKDGDAQEVKVSSLTCCIFDGLRRVQKEAPLPHSARSMSFFDNDTVCFAYSPTEYAVFSIPTLSATDISTPLPTTTTNTAMGAFSGFTGYMTLGLGAKPKPGVVQINETEVLILKDRELIFKDVLDIPNSAKMRAIL